MNELVSISLEDVQKELNKLEEKIQRGEHLNSFEDTLFYVCILLLQRRNKKYEKEKK